MRNWSRYDRWKLPQAHFPKSSASKALPPAIASGPIRVTEALRREFGES